MILPFKLHTSEAAYPHKKLVEKDSEELSMYEHTQPRTFNILGHFPKAIFLYFHEGKLVSVLVKMHPSSTPTAHFELLQHDCTAALNSLPETLPSGSVKGVRWETDFEVLALLEATADDPITFVLADKKHSLF